MSLADQSSLEVVSLVLTKEQARRLREMRDTQKSDHRRVSLSDVAREVVEAGLVVISHTRNIDIAATVHSNTTSSKVA